MYKGWPTRREYLVDALEQYEQLASRATEAESWTAAVNAKLRAENTRSAIDQIDQAAVISQIPATSEEHRIELIRRVRALRASAEASNSFVAAANLMKLEAELLEAADSRRLAEEVPETRTLDDVLAEAKDRLAALPDVVKLRAVNG